MSQFDKPYLRLSSTVTIKKGVPTRPHRKDNCIDIPDHKLKIVRPDYSFTEKPEAGARGAAYAIIALVISIAVLIAMVAR